MLNRPLLVTAVSAGLLATLLSACGGSSSTPPAPQNNMGSGIYNPTGAGLSTDVIHAHPAATLTVKPAKMTFKSMKEQQAQLTPNTDFYSQKNGCVHKHILKSVKYFDYGIFYITPGNTKGTCTVTFTDTVTKATAKMTVVNDA
jgi:hypothetical protein